LYCIGRDITERKRTEQAIQAYQQKLRALASELTLTEERERRRIADDLHDRVGQSLALARMQIAVAKEATAGTPVATSLEEASRHMLQATRDTRGIMYDLSSPAMAEIGLDAAISEWLEDRIAGLDGLQIRFSGGNMDISLEDNVKAVLFRCVRELVTNVVKHAKAGEVVVRMESESGILRIAVKDNGVGFDPSTDAQARDDKSGFGLFSIRERMAYFGGFLEIESAPRKGCKAVLTVPVGS
jgi:signal transduction histidine kinase